MYYIKRRTSEGFPLAVGCMKWVERREAPDNAGTINTKTERFISFGVDEMGGQKKNVAWEPMFMCMCLCTRMVSFL